MQNEQGRDSIFRVSHRSSFSRLIGKLVVNEIHYRTGAKTNMDCSCFRARNFSDNSALSLPYGADRKQQGSYLTWVRRQSEHLIYTVKYGYVTNRDGTWAGRNDFDAHVVYAKVQHRF